MTMRRGPFHWVGWSIPGLLSAFACAAVSLGLRARTTGAQGVQIDQEDDALSVKIDGRLLTRYIFAGAPKPYCWPIIGPTGAPLTRSYPMAQVAGETMDHPHQRSLWFTHGSVN